MSIINKKDTDNLSEQLMAQDDIDSYIKENQDVFINRSITVMLAELYKNCSLSKAELARRSGMSEVYLHQLFSGRRKPSRDKLLCLCIGMKLSLEQTQDLLKEAAYVQLYPRVKREAIICHAILHGRTLASVNEKMLQEHEKTLC